MSSSGSTQATETTARARKAILARAVTYGVVIILGAIAIAFTPPLPDPQPAARVLATGPRPPAWPGAGAE